MVDQYTESEALIGLEIQFSTFDRLYSKKESAQRGKGCLVAMIAKNHVFTEGEEKHTQLSVMYGSVSTTWSALHTDVQTQQVQCGKQ